MKIKFYLPIIFIGFFIVEAISGFTYNVGDEQVYYYMGSLVAKGYIPYKDFFYAHPPLQLLLYGLLFKFVPYNFIELKFIVIILTIVNSFLLYLIVKKDFGENTAVLASTIGLWSPTVLFNASFEYGLTISLLLFFLGLKSNSRGFWQSLLFLLSAFYRTHMVFLIMGYYIYKIFSKEYDYIRKGIWFINIFLIINLFLIVLIPNYFQYTIQYHINKPHIPTQTFDTAFTIIKINYLIFLLPLILLFYLKKDIHQELLKYIIIPIPFLIFLLLTIFFGYYFILVIPFLAVISAYTIYMINNKFIYIPLFIYIVINLINYPLLISHLPDMDMLHDNITGDSAIVSYMALTNNLDVMNNDVDTNSMIYEGNIRNITYYITDIMVKHPMVIVNKGEGLYVRIREFINYINTCNLILEDNTYKVVKCWLDLIRNEEVTINIGDKQTKYLKYILEGIAKERYTFLTFYNEPIKKSKGGVTEPPLQQNNGFAQ